MPQCPHSPMPRAGQRSRNILRGMGRTWLKYYEHFKRPVIARLPSPQQGVTPRTLRSDRIGRESVLAPEDEVWVLWYWVKWTRLIVLLQGQADLPFSIPCPGVEPGTGRSPFLDANQRPRSPLVHHHTSTCPRSLSRSGHLACLLPHSFKFFDPQSQPPSQGG